MDERGTPFVAFVAPFRTGLSHSCTTIGEERQREDAAGHQHIFQMPL